MLKFVKLGAFTLAAFFFEFILYGESLANTSIMPEDYIQYLTERGKTDPEALEVRDQFKSYLPEIRKSLYII